ncbi:hypothetical protein ETB97_002787 [Aspergillus alliaceus]|uniref:Ketosynthase family 3 (KS3) domain-containing protein n=1 Tax=Petromyces alliaceus TaxID=209559 RepID=A0A8H6E4V6_PETAA|nr:hypothetical protein ETB97_002787 [Aspergillus burnettii]
MTTTMSDNMLLSPSGICKSSDEGFDGYGRELLVSPPESSSQMELIQCAYKKALIHDLSETAFFECLGTGTSVGDTSETSVVANLFQVKGILVGAVKPNVGHSEGASGITSIIKAALALERQMVPQMLTYLCQIRRSHGKREGYMPLLCRQTGR